MIDIHSHILPEVDDGSKSLDESLLIIDKLRELGFERIVLTPHLDLSAPQDKRTLISNAFERFVPQVKKEIPSIELVLGSEALLVPELLECEPATPMSFTILNKSYQLIELNPFFHRSAIESYITYFRRYALTPILAHVERVQKLCDDTNALRELKNYGMLFQCDLASFLKMDYNPFFANASRLFAEGLIDIVGTDCHSSRGLPLIESALESFRQMDEDWEKYFSL